MTKTSKGFRMSPTALKHLAHIQKKTGLTQTAVVEMALAMLALGLTDAATPPQLPTGAAAHTHRSATSAGKLKETK
jgi:hypothetical protein